MGHNPDHPTNFDHSTLCIRRVFCRVRHLQGTHQLLCGRALPPKFSEIDGLQRVAYITVRLHLTSSMHAARVPLRPKRPGQLSF
jgi:hypothetical protein